MKLNDKKLMKKIRLIDVDGKMPNLALMKIASHHKNRGDDVGWYSNILFDGDSDIVYMSKLFNFTPDFSDALPDCDIIAGGTGYNVSSSLPPEIEACDPDYSIYPDCDYSIQLFSRGCIRDCSFCVVCCWLYRFIYCWC